MDPTTPSDNELVVLRAVERAARFSARGGQWRGARTDEVALILGRTRRDLLNTKRERLMTSLRKAGLIEKTRDAISNYWRPTQDGLDALAAASK